MLDVRAHPLRGNAGGGVYQEIIRIVRPQEAQPTPIGKRDHSARRLAQVSPGSSRLVEHVSRRKGALKDCTVQVGPFPDRRMLQGPHVFISVASSSTPAA